MEYLPARVSSAVRRQRSGDARGFSLVELLVAMVIVGVLLAVGVPSMTQFLADQAAAGNADEFAEALRFARSEAIKRGRSVTICASSDGASCGQSWTTGWVVMSADNSQVLRVQNALRAMDSITSPATSVSFVATGIVVGGGTGDYIFTPLGGESSRARTVNLNVQGRVTVTKGGA